MIDLKLFEVRIARCRSFFGTGGAQQLFPVCGI
jgi:hypothetical protein